MRLLFCRLLHLKLGSGFVHLALEFIARFLEFSQALAKSAGEFGQLFGTKKKNHDQNDKDRFRPAGHTKGERETHMDKTTLNQISCKGNSQFHRFSNRHQMKG